MTGIDIYSKYVDEDKGYYLVRNNAAYKSGVEICRGPFPDDTAATVALEKYERLGKWDTAPPDTTEVDL